MSGDSKWAPHVRLTKDLPHKARVPVSEDKSEHDVEHREYADTLETSVKLDTPVQRERAFPNNVTDT